MHTQEIERAIAHLGRRDKLHLIAILARSLLRGDALAQRPLDGQDTRGQAADRPSTDSIAMLLNSDFIGCAGTTATQFSRDYKRDLTAILDAKHGHR